MFEMTARLKIREGELEGFKRQAAELMRLTYGEPSAALAELSRKPVDADTLQLTRGRLSDDAARFSFVFSEMLYEYDLKNEKLVSTVTVASPSFLASVDPDELLAACPLVDDGVVFAGLLGTDDGNVLLTPAAQPMPLSST